MKKDLFSIVMEWSDEEQEFVATCPEFPGLSAFGETKAEALAEAELVLESFIEILEEDGDPIPEPRKLESCSGQTRLRMPKSLHARLKREAERDGVSLNQHIVQQLTEKQTFREALAEVENRLEQKKQKAESFVMVSEYNLRTSGSVGPEMVGTMELGPGVSIPNLKIAKSMPVASDIDETIDYGEPAS